jgi:glycerate kinase
MDDTVVLVAPGPFKECLSADKVAMAIARGVRLARPELRVQLLPMCDGGSGFVDRIVTHADGRFIKTTARDPIGRQIEAVYGLVEHNGNRTAIIESAAVAGLALLDSNLRDPRHTTTAGVGDLIQHAVFESGCRHVIVGCGDSATNDGGAGMARALGVRFLDAGGQDLPEGGAGLRRLATIDVSSIADEIRQTQFRVACNVSSILCGPDGASAIYGPQKGASPETVIELDEALEVYAAAIYATNGDDVRFIPGGGGSGGLGAGIYAFLNGNLNFSINVVREFVNLDAAIQASSLVFTGEGCVDDRTSSGKVVACVALAAKKVSKPVVAICGSIGLGAERMYYMGLEGLFSITEGPTTIDASMKDAEILIEKTAFRIMQSMGTANTLSL